MKRIALFVSAVALTATASLVCADPGKDESGKGRYEDKSEFRNDRDDDKSRKERDDRSGSRSGVRESYFRDRGYTRLDIPPGHYPPPGECRVWFPDRPAGQQPPPEGCRIVPPGAWAIRHPADRPDHVHVVVYEPERPGSVYAVGEFEIGSGGLVRVVLDP